MTRANAPASRAARVDWILALEPVDDMIVGNQYDDTLAGAYTKEVRWCLVSFGDILQILANPNGVAKTNPPGLEIVVM